MSQNLSLIICGFTGRMGQAIAKVALQDSKIKIIGAVASLKNKDLGKDIGHLLGTKALGIELQNSLDNTIKAARISKKDQPVIVDFSSAASTLENVKVAEKHNIPLVIGTTALKAKELKAIENASKKTPILKAPNMSLGANALFALAANVAKWMPESDVEIVEVHHSGKKDCPSGTALLLAEHVAKSRKQKVEKHLVLNRLEKGQRKAGEIGIVGIRGGNAKGEHTIYFLGENESIEIKHHVNDSSVFAKGALKAAWYLTKQTPGLYDMSDVLEEITTR